GPLLGKLSPRRSSGELDRFRACTSSRRRTSQNSRTTEQGSAIDKSESMELWHTLAALRRWPCSALPNVRNYRDRHVAKRTGTALYPHVCHSQRIRKYREMSRLRST